MVISSAETVSGSESEDGAGGRCGSLGEFVELLSQGACFGIEVLRPRGYRAQRGLAAWTGSARLARSGRSRAQAVTNCAEDRPQAGCATARGR